MVKSVLYIEKEKFLRTLFEAALRPRQVEIHTIESLQNNLYLLGDLSPALIIIDLETAQLTPELVSEVFNYREVHPETKIIGTGVLENRTNFNFRFDDFFAKPIVVSGLASRIMKIID